MPSQPRNTPDAPMGHDTPSQTMLEILQGDDINSYFVLKNHETLIGRYEFCDLILEEKSVSRQHARICRTEAGYFLEDAGSVNGTFLNGRRIEEPTRLNDHDRIRFYKVLAVFHEGAEGPPLPASSESAILNASLPSQPARRQQVLNTLASRNLSDMVYSEQRLQAILKINQLLGSTLVLEEILSNILDGLFQVFSQANRGYIFSPRGKKLELHASKERGEETVCSKTWAPMHLEIAHQTLAEKRAILGAETEEGNSESVFDEGEVRSIMCAPLAGPTGEILAVVYLDTTDEDNAFVEADLNVLYSVAIVAGQAVEHAEQHADHLRLCRQQAEAEAEAEAARSVQQHLLPRTAPEVPGYEMAGKCQPAEYVGGDLYDYLPWTDDRLGIVIGDVSRHGVPAALLMASTRRVLRSLVKSHPDLGSLMTAVNEAVCEDTDTGQFITMFLARLDPARKQLTYVGAGHDAWLINPDGTSQNLESTSMPLGIAPDEIMSESTPVSLQAGQILLLMTDGLHEAQNLQHDLLGKPVLVKYLHEHRDLSAQQLVDSLFDLATQHCVPNRPQDDVAAVIIKILG